MLLTPFPNGFGLDISDLSVKLVQLRNVSHRLRRPAFSLLSVRATQLPYGLITNGILDQPESVRKYIYHLLRKTDRAGRLRKSPWVVASLPDTQGYLKLIHLEKAPDDIIDEDIGIAARKHFPISADDYYLDWQIMPSHGTTDHTDVLLCAMPKTISDMYTYLLESLGLAVVALEIQAMATARAMITAQKVYVNEARAILDLGAVRTTVIIYDHNHLQFSRALPYSGELLTTAIAQKLHLSPDEAEKKKRDTGLQYKNSPVWPIMTKYADELVGQIQETFEFYYSHFSDANRITHVTMSGGGAATKRLDAVLSLKLGIESQPGHAWKNLGLPIPETYNEQALAGFATAIGLALRAADNPYFKTDTL